MEIRRTANAGILLKLDGVSILLDGVSQKVGAYLATPPDIKEWILNEKPDAFVFTHTHSDHYDPDFAKAYLAAANGVIIGPEDLNGNNRTMRKENIGSVSVTPVKSRHIGKFGEIEHYSYIIEGTRCVWFLGDASPLQWRQESGYPKPDVVVAPFAYASTETAWSRTKMLGAEKVVLVHLPDKVNDPDNLWDMVQTATKDTLGDEIEILAMNEMICI